MKVTFYATSDDRRTVNKNLTLLYETETFNIKENSSIVNPTLIVTTFDHFPQCNYFYIEEFNRYYFVTDLISIRKDALQITGKSDVLMSNKEDILNMKGIIDRSAVGENNYLADVNQNFLNYKTNEIININKGFNETPTYVLTVAGGN